MNAGTREGAATQAIGSGTVAHPHSRTLHDLVRDLPEAELRGSADTLVSSVCYRSDDARPGALFFCVPGSTSDGHAFAGDAVSRGSMGLVVDRWLELDVSQVKVLDVREAMGPISAAFYGRPADGMTVDPFGGEVRDGDGERLERRRADHEGGAFLGERGRRSQDGQHDGGDNATGHGWSVARR